MAKDKLTDYDATASNNTDVGGISVAEGMLPSGVNNAIREQMSHQKEAFGLGTPLYVDQTNNRLGIGTASPSTALDVAGGLNTTDFDVIPTSSSNYYPQISGGVDGGADAYLALSGGTSGNGNLAIKARGTYREIKFYTRGSSGSASTTERLRILSSGGITFNGDTAAANALDDYEYGTWNPSIGGTATYNVSNYGRYTKIGNVVTLQFHISIASVGTGSTTSIINLPFTSENIGEVQSGHVSYFGNLATATNFLSFYVLSNSTSISFVGNTGNNTTVALNGFAVFGTNTSIYGSITYRTA